jgi:hypothetical protein
MQQFDNIFLAHHKTKLPLILWGSSGYGKSSTVKGFCKRHNYRLVDKRTVFIDPLEIQLPVKNETERVVDLWPARWLHELCKSNEPTVLFLDELNRPNSIQTLNMLTQLLLDRELNGIHLPDNVLVVAAGNLDTEDTGVQELPDAVINRLTHLVFAPDEFQIIGNMQSKLAQEALKLNPKIAGKPGLPELKLKNCPRQIDAAVQLWETELLNEEELALVCRGRLGNESGNVLASTLLQIKRQQEFKLPRKVTPEAFEKIAQCEQEGMIIEIVSLFKTELETNEGKRTLKKVERHIADYLLQHGSPELARSMQEAKFAFRYDQEEFPLDKDGQSYKDNRPNKDNAEIKDTGLPWQLYALKLGKLSPKDRS